MFVYARYLWYNHYMMDNSTGPEALSCTVFNNSHSAAHAAEQLNELGRRRIGEALHVAAVAGIVDVAGVATIAMQAAEAPPGTELHEAYGQIEIGLGTFALVLTALGTGMYLRGQRLMGQ
jgi:hypothetical protein